MKWHVHVVLFFTAARNTAALSAECTVIRRFDNSTLLTNPALAGYAANMAQHSILHCTVSTVDTSNAQRSQKFDFDSTVDLPLDDRSTAYYRTSQDHSDVT